jgi:hypothetical protein
MSRFKDFGAPLEDNAKESLSFKLYGEEFNCRSAIQGKVLLQFAASSSSENAADSTDAILGFFKVALLPESHERFEKLIEDPDKIVSVETLGEIIGWILETYSNRPTQVSSD